MNKFVDAAVDVVGQAKAEAARRWPEDAAEKVATLMLEAFNLLNSDNQANVSVPNLVAKYAELR